MDKKELIKQFEGMTKLAELKALSEYSLTHELSNKQYNRFMELKKEVMQK